MKNALHIQHGGTYAQIARQHSYVPTNIKQQPHTNQPYQQTTSNLQDLKNMLKSLCEQVGTILKLLSTVLFKFK
jgi:hypothetical protein